MTKLTTKSFPKLRILSRKSGNAKNVSNVSGTIGDMMTSCSNVKVDPKLKAIFFKAIKEENKIRKEERDSKRKSQVRNATHISFVKCVEWNKTCDNEELIKRGVF